MADSINDKQCSDCGFELDYTDEDGAICYRCDYDEYRRMYQDIRVKFGRLKAQTEWVAVRSEVDLPKISGEYIVIYKGGHYFQTAVYDPTEQPFWLMQIVAYLPQPIPPYQPTSGNTATGEKNA